jgi:hypothetical protein
VLGRTLRCAEAANPTDTPHMPEFPLVFIHIGYLPYVETAVRVPMQWLEPGTGFVVLLLALRALAWAGLSSGAHASVRARRSEPLAPVHH